MQSGRVRKISPIGLQNTQRKILRNFAKFYLDADKIAVSMDKICSSLDKIARDNRQNSVKISRLVDWIPTLPCYLMRAVFIASAKGGIVLGFDTQ
ncbi:hypothetical protein [uncultured Campylobacter sp.]|uniref:hypothetical protein n=1 Tax=uncultured Campylobacter sp. TaxID=218934 RepID=UPI002602C93E|nr:hypothetical protein [uncultured Campylobacter sp.]